MPDLLVPLGDSVQLKPLGVPSVGRIGGDSPASWKHLLPSESTLERQAQAGRRPGREGLGWGHPVYNRTEWGLRAAHVCFRLFFFFLHFIEQEMFIQPTNKHLGVVVGLGQ